MKNCVVVFFSIVAVAVVADDGYCGMNCLIEGKEVKHIACDNDGKFSASCPEDVEMIDIDENLKEFILDEHNRRRNTFAGVESSTHGPACRMATMQWDYELAALAALKCEECSPDLEYCHGTRAFPNSTHYTRELFYADFTAEGMIKSIVATNLEIDQDIGLYTDSNIRLGCAASSATADFTRKNGQKVSQVWFTCNYANGKNSYDQCTTAGEKCVTGLNGPQYPYLCSINEQF